MEQCQWTNVKVGVMSSLPALFLRVLPAVEKANDDPRDGTDDDGCEEGEEEVPGVGGGVQVGDGETGVCPGVEAVYRASIDSTGVVPAQSTTQRQYKYRVI